MLERLLRATLSGEVCTETADDDGEPNKTSMRVPEASMSKVESVTSESHSRHEEYAKLEKILGKGAMLFAPRNEPTTAEQIDALSDVERSGFETLLVELEVKGYRKTKSNVLSDEWCLRLARYCDFNVAKALKYTESFDLRYADLECKYLEKQLLSETLFIPPGLQTKEGYGVLYMRPSRYFPNQTSTDVIIDNLVYCMQVMQEKREGREGIAFLANMADWKRENFNIFYCRQFMYALQGHTTPVKVRLFLIVDPPKWFNYIWDVMKTFMSSEFASKVVMIQSEQLSCYLKEGFLAHLPNEMPGGRARVKRMVADFIRYRKYVEGTIEERNAEERKAALFSRRISISSFSDEIIPVGKQ